MNIIRSIALTVLALSATAALAHDGSERASPAAEKIRIAQELRYNDQLNSEASRLVNTDKQLPVNTPEKG